MKNKSAGLYDPFLDTMGGGEKHILSILKVLHDCGYSTTVFWDENLSGQIKNKFSSRLSNRLMWGKNIFGKKNSFLKKFFTLKKLYAFFYVTDGSYFFSPAKKNFIFCMVPQKNLYKMTFLNKLKTANYIFISNSLFTQKKLAEFGISSELIYPYVDDIFLTTQTENKEKIILSVGRFFGHLHSKNHEQIIQSFNRLKNTILKEYKLVLVGGLKNEDKQYYDKLFNRIKDDKNIILGPNISFEKLLELYRKASIFWHFAGFGVDENEHPERVEHLGITPLEAMASGCATFCYNAGGPKEFIINGKNGFLFSSEDELGKQMEQITNNNSLQNKLSKNAQEYVRAHFSYKTFKENVQKVLNL